MAEPLSWRLIQSVIGFINAAQQPSSFFNWKAKSELWQLDEEDLDSENAVTEFDPIAYVIEDDDTTDETYAKSTGDTVSLVIEAYIRLSTDAAQLQAHRAKSDLHKCIPKRTVGNLPVGAHSLVITNARILQKPEGIPFVVVQIRLRANLNETATAP